MTRTLGVYSLPPARRVPGAELELAALGPFSPSNSTAEVLPLAAVRAGAALSSGDARHRGARRATTWVGTWGTGSLAEVRFLSCSGPKRVRARCSMARSRRDFRGAEAVRR